MTPKKKKTQKRYETKKSDHLSEERYLMCLDFDFDNCLFFLFIYFFLHFFFHLKHKY